MESLRDSAYNDGKFSMDIVCVDSSFIETKKRGENSAYNGHKRRNGIKIHACVSCEGFPLTIQISSGKEHDRQHFIEVMEDIKVKTSGRPRARPLEVLADAAYDDVDIRKYFLIESKTSLHVQFS